MKLLSYFNKQRTEKEKGIIALVLLAPIFPITSLFSRFLSTDFTLLQQTYLKVLFAFIVSLIVFYKKTDFNKLQQISLKEWGVVFFRATSLYLVGVGLLTEAIILTKFSNVSFIAAFPVTAVYGFIFFREKLTKGKLFFVLLGFLGVILVAVQDYSHLFSWGLGEVLALVGTLSFSLSFVARKWQSNLLNDFEITEVTLFASTIVIFLCSLIFGEGLPINGWHINSSLALFAVGVFTVLNVLLSNYGFKRVAAVVGNNLLPLETVFAIIFGFSFYKEVPQLKDIIGGIIVLFSAIGMNLLESTTNYFPGGILKKLTIFEEA